MRMRLTKRQAVAISRLAHWFKCQPEELIHAMLNYQLDYLLKVKDMAAEERQIVKKYRLAQRFKLLD